MDFLFRICRKSRDLFRNHFHYFLEEFFFTALSRENLGLLSLSGDRRLLGVELKWATARLNECKQIMHHMIVISLLNFFPFFGGVWSHRTSMIEVKSQVWSPESTRNERRRTHLEDASLSASPPGPTASASSGGVTQQSEALRLASKCSSTKRATSFTTLLN